MDSHPTSFPAALDGVVGCLLQHHEAPPGLKSCNQHSIACTVLWILDLKEEPGTLDAQVTFSESL